MDKSLTPVIKELATAVSVSNTHTINIGKLLGFSLKCLLVGMSILFATNIAFADKPQDARIKTYEEMEEEREANRVNGKVAKVVARKGVEIAGEDTVVAGTTLLGEKVAGTPGALVGAFVGKVIVETVKDTANDQKERELRDSIKSEIETEQAIQELDKMPHLKLPKILSQPKPKSKPQPKPQLKPQLKPQPKPQPKSDPIPTRARERDWNFHIPPSREYRDHVIPDFRKAGNEIA